jgi:APA family basic amino acid/polyamine antiporter
MAELRREISLINLVLIAVGASVGVGIFLTPGKIADYMQNPSNTLFVWALGGLITILGAMTFAELGGMYPKAGGIYVYLREAYGDMIAFLYGWVTLLVVNTGSLAFLALAFAKYFNFVFHVGYDGIQIVAVLMIIFVTLLNVFTVSMGAYISASLTGLKIIGLTALIISGLIWVSHGVIAAAEIESTSANEGSNPFALALIGVLFSYGGWQHATFLSGEVKNDRKNIPKAMVIASVIITLIYILTNLSYMFLLPFEQICKSNTLAADAMQTIFPDFGGLFIAAVVMISALGTATIYLFGVPRIYYAMARDGVFFKQLAVLHPRVHTPVNAILLQSLWSIVLIIFWGRLEDIINYVVFTDWIFFFLAAVSLFVLRIKVPKADRPFKVWGYPTVPLLFSSIVLWFIVNLLFSNGDVHEQIMASVFIMLAGIFFYFYFKKYRNAIAE